MRSWTELRHCGLATIGSQFDRLPGCFAGVEKACATICDSETHMFVKTYLYFPPVAIYLLWEDGSDSASNRDIALYVWR